MAAKENKKTNGNQPGAAQPKSNQPLFYENPVPLQVDRHAKAGLSRDTNFKFTRDTNSCPVNIQEFALIAKTYPIVFTGDDLAAPVAVLGLENSKNLFVNSAGAWEKNTYIPAYVRRYPFAFTGASDDKLILCVDESSPRYKEAATKNDDKFFDGKEQAEMTKAALQYCLDFHRDQKVTLQFTKLLKEKGLLIDRQVTANLTGRKEPVVLGGFRIIDEEKFRNLDEKTVNEWFRNGFLSLVHFHMMSLSNWQTLVNRMGS